MTAPAVPDEVEDLTTGSMPEVEPTAPDVAEFDDDEEEDFDDTGAGEGAEASAPDPQSPTDPAPDPVPEPVLDDLVLDLPGGERYAAPGIKIDTAGHRIIAESAAALQRLLTQARHGRTFETTYRPQIEKLSKDLKAKDGEIEQARAESGQLVQSYGELMGLDWPSAVARFQADYEKWPQAQHDARERRLTEWEQQLKAPRPDDAGQAVVIEDVADWARALSSKMLREASASALPWLTEDAIRDIEPAMTDPDELWNAKVVRYATEQDVQANPSLTLGQFMVDGPRFLQVVKHRYEPGYVKAQTATQQAQKQLQTMGSIATRNAKVLAAGTPPAATQTKAPPSKPKPPESEEERRERAESAWAARRSEIARELATKRR